MGRRKRSNREISEAALIGKKLREEREGAQLSQAELGAKIGGRSQRLISKYESGQASIPLSVLLRICRELGLDFRWLIDVLDPDLAGEFHQDEFRRYGQNMLGILRDFIVMDVGKVRRDPSLAADAKRAYEIGAEKLKAVRREDLHPNSINEFIWDILRTIGRPEGGGSMSTGPQNALPRVSPNKPVRRED